WCSRAGRGPAGCRWAARGGGRRAGSSSRCGAWRSRRSRGTPTGETPGADSMVDPVREQRSMRPTAPPVARRGRFIVYVFLAALAGPIKDIAGGQTPTWLALAALAGFVASFVLFVELGDHP